MNHLTSNRTKWAILATCATLAASSNAMASKFGTSCQSAYQSSWQTTLSYAYDTCSNFRNELNDTDTDMFYWDLVGGQAGYHDTSDHLRLDAVDLHFGMTHGAFDASNAYWAMYESNTYATSNNMILGNEGQGLSILANMSCYQLTNGDSKMTTRWANTFRGGLRYVTGSHDTIYDGITLDENGEDFADYLQNGDSILFSWREGLYDWWEDQDIAVMASGSSSSNCNTRRDDMQWSTFGSYARVTTNLTHLCRTTWTNY